MCTIMTIDRDFYLANRTEVVARIREDWRNNPHGASLLLIGEMAKDTSLIRSMSIDDILLLVELRFLNSTASRIFLHLRFATTGFIGLNGCHGFAANNYTVMHNGVLKRKEASYHNVDSELIAQDIVIESKAYAIAQLQKHETYANVFIIDNDTGKYDVIRQSTGSLYTDGKGNYSSNPCGTLYLPVLPGYHAEYSKSIVLPTLSKAEYYDDIYTFDYKDGHLDDNSWLISTLSSLKDFEEFAEFAMLERWDQFGIPREVYDALSTEQLRWVKEVGLFIERAYTKSYG